MIRNVADGQWHVVVHRADAAEPDHVVTACGLGPLNAEYWAFTDDEVTCEECKQ